MASILSPKVIAPNDTFHFERSLRKKGFTCIAGTDEVGRGPLAGPVVAACVILPVTCNFSIFLDSKTISHSRRLELYNTIKEIDAETGLGIVPRETIDDINILQSSLLAMKLAVLDLEKRFSRPDFLLVDGKFEVPLLIPQETLVKGESKSASIAAASIVAKIERDRLMDRLHEKYPQYNFKSNKGYPTKEHRQAVATFGPCPDHRTTFKGVKEFV